MDGVVGMTQSAVPPGAEFLYDFALRDAGTYWYHPHNRTHEQMARGLYGALIVDERADAPVVDRDEVLLIDDWRLNDKAQIADGVGNIHETVFVWLSFSNHFCVICRRVISSFTVWHKFARECCPPQHGIVYI